MAQADPPTSTDREVRALRFSMFGYLGMGVIGGTFALLTGSEAILLDGAYSTLNFLAAIAASRVARLLARPADDAFPIGYVYFEPAVNTIRGLFILGICLFAFFSALNALLHGGRALSPGLGVAYGVLSAVLCVLMALNQRRLAKRHASPLLDVDARNWFVDGIFSAVVAVAFIAAFILSRTSAAHLVVYVDPVLVIVLVLAMLRIPLGTIWQNVREILAFGPPPELRAIVRERVEKALEDVKAREIHIRSLKVGRTFYVLTHVLLPEDRVLGTAADLDAMRRKVAAAFTDAEYRIVTETIFTTDEQWLHSLDHRLMGA